MNKSASRRASDLTHRLIEVRGYKWPRRATGIATACLLGEDNYGRWLGIAIGDPWRTADGSRSGVFDSTFIKLVPSGTFWTACFNPTGHVVDVDIVLPVTWLDDVLEEVDLELDILRSEDGTVQVRDRDQFEHVRNTWNMPHDIVQAAETTCIQIVREVAQGIEPFGSVGRAWLARWMAEQ